MTLSLMRFNEGARRAGSRPYSSYEPLGRVWKIFGVDPDLRKQQTWPRLVIINAMVFGEWLR